MPVDSHCTSVVWIIVSSVSSKFSITRWAFVILYALITVLILGWEFETDVVGGSKLEEFLL